LRRAPRPPAGRPEPTWSRAAAARPAWTCRRRRNRRWRTAAEWWPREPRSWWCSCLEVPLALAVLHRGLGQLVVGAGGAALGQPGGGDLGDHLLDRVGVGVHRAGAGHVAHGPVAHQDRKSTR